MVIACTSVEFAQIEKLLHSIRISDYDQIRRICEKGVEGIINYNNPADGETPLLAAVKKNDETMVQFLLDLGAYPDLSDFKGQTPLIHAAKRGFLESIKVLLKGKATIDIQDLDGDDVLFACLSDGTLRQQQCFSIIMSMRMPDINRKTGKGTPLLVAACEKALALENICLMLIAYGSDVNSVDKITGKTALHAACAAGSVKVTRELLQRKANPNARDIQQQTPVHAAVTSKIFQLLPILSAYNARFDLVDQSLNTPIHLAVMLNQGRSIQFMVQRGGITKTKDIENNLPIRKAIKEVEKRNFHRKILLLKSNPDRDYRIHFYDWLQERSNRLLKRFHQVENIQTHRITSNDFKHIIKEEGFTQISSDDLNDLIIQHETNPNEIDYQTFLSGKLWIEKPYLLQAFFNEKKVKKRRKKKTQKQIPIPIALRDEGPRTSHGNPPLVYIKKHRFITDNNRFSRDRIPKHVINDDSAFYIDHVDPQFIHVNNAAYRGDLHTLNDAFKSGVPVDIRDKFYKTPLMIAAANGDLETTKFLLQCGANVHLDDNFKWTSLHHAANSGQLNVVQALVDAGANVNHESITLSTPLSRAIESSAHDIVEYLIQKRANVRHVNIMQRNLLDLAEDFGSSNISDTVRTAYEQKEKKNMKQQIINRRRPVNTTAKNRNVNLSPATIKPVKLDVPLPRRGSLLTSERNLLLPDTVLNSVKYPLFTQWTTQPTTRELLDKKLNLRNRFTMNIDFRDYRSRLLKIALDKLDCYSKTT